MFSTVFLSTILSPYDQHRWPFKCSVQIIQLQRIQHDINININIMTRPVSMCFEGEIVQLPRLQHSWHISSSLRPVLQGRRASCHHHCDGHGFDHYIFQLPFHFCQLLCKFTGQFVFTCSTGLR